MLIMTCVRRINSLLGLEVWQYKHKILFAVVIHRAKETIPGQQSKYFNTSGLAFGPVWTRIERYMRFSVSLFWRNSFGIILTFPFRGLNFTISVRSTVLVLGGVIVWPMGPSNVSLLVVFPSEKKSECWIEKKNRSIRINNFWFWR